jgi:hypothetical protein
MSPLSPELKSKPSVQQVAGEASDFWLGFFLNPENGVILFPEILVGFQRTTQCYPGRENFS